MWERGFHRVKRSQLCSGMSSDVVYATHNVNAQYLFRLPYETHFPTIHRLVQESYLLPLEKHVFWNEPC